MLKLAKYALLVAVIIVAFFGVKFSVEKYQEYTGGVSVDAKVDEDVDYVTEYNAQIVEMKAVMVEMAQMYRWVFSSDFNFYLTEQELNDLGYYSNAIHRIRGNIEALDPPAEHRDDHQQALDSLLIIEDSLQEMYVDMHLMVNRLQSWSEFYVVADEFMKVHDAYFEVPREIVEDDGSL